MAWACLADQVVRLPVGGVTSADAVSLVGSVLLGALLVGWVSAGVVRARTVRLVVAWVVLGLAGAFGVVGLFVAEGSVDLLVTVLSLATTIAALAGLGSSARPSGTRGSAPAPTPVRALPSPRWSPSPWRSVPWAG